MLDEEARHLRRGVSDGMRIALVALLFASCALAPQGPHDQRPKSTARRQNDASANKSPAATPVTTDTRVADSLVKSTIDNKKQATKEQKNSADPKSFWDVTITDVAIAFFAFCAVVVGFFQWNAMKASVAAASSAASQQSVEMQAATAVTAGQLTAMQRQADQMDVEFVATHRPNLVVRSIGYKEISVPGVEVIGAVEFVIANTGGSDADIIEVCASTWYHNKVGDRAARPPYEAETIKTLTGETINDGGWIGHTLNRDHELWKQVRDLRADEILRASKELLFIGYIKYADAALGEDQGRYRTAFCRVFDGKRFVPEDPLDPDYEYQP